MQTTALYKALGLTLGAALVAACSSTGEVSDSDGSSVSAAQQAVEEASGAATNAVDTATVSGQELEAEAEAAGAAAAEVAAAALREMTVFYFDFDDATLLNTGKEALYAHAAFLKNNPSIKLVLEGHADERGTVEYNLALGNRRGMSVRQYLLANGASSSQIKVVSYGEERPVATGHNEGSWAKNRRVELKYQN